MENKNQYTIEELLTQIDTLKKTIKVQNDTINRLMDAYILNSKPECKTSK